MREIWGEGLLGAGMFSIILNYFKFFGVLKLLFSGLQFLTDYLYEITDCSYVVMII